MPLQSNPNLLPVEHAQEVIQGMAQPSAALALSRRVTMSTRQQRMPAASVLADAQWVGQGAGDSTGRKRETNQEWTGVNLNVEEVAALVAIPNAYAQDSNFPIWEETRPRIVEALGAKVDQAVFFGLDKPATWPDDLWTSIQAAGNVTETDPDGDLAGDIARSAQLLTEKGTATNAFATSPGFGWRLVGMRSGQGAPIYQPDLAGPIRTGIYGFPATEVANGAWAADGPVLIHGDFMKSIIGIRQDITFEEFPSGVITDGAGNVTFNAMEQDSTIWRAVLRIAWARANPVNRLATDEATRFPFAAVAEPVEPVA